MEEIIKEILYWVALGSGSIALVCLFITGTIRVICILIDHLKILSVLRDLLDIYIQERVYKPKKAQKDKVKFNGGDKSDGK